ncbi:hypothetical protein [Verrucomicrobium sp. 3C]|uniref:hypothetical protein n=1 Tax=Verrucomicrobium sp. 3C TaxID=1134055 RepID=UPI00037C7E6F|nr:hypothetical protein [Verrucomicrobium sp. 3C]
MKLSVWAKQQGICYRTAWRMGKDKRLPVPVEQLPTGTVIVHAEAAQPDGVALYYTRAPRQESTRSDP